MINKLIFGHKFILRPLLQSLKKTNYSDNITKIQEMETKIKENTERVQVIMGLMAKGYLEPALFNTQKNELLKEAALLKEQKEAIKRAIDGSQTILVEVEKLLKFATKAEKQIDAFDSEIFEDFTRRNHCVFTRRNRFQNEMRVELKGKVGEMMSHIPFGYTIQNGRAVVNEEEAVKIEKLFEAYLSGLSLSEAAQKAGIKRYHTSIARMLSDKRYVEDKFYPPIISKDTFEKAQLERHRRAEALGRIYEHKGNEKKCLNFRFHASMPDNLYDDPFQQAEYAYSLIKSEVILDDNQECYGNSCP